MKLKELASKPKLIKMTLDDEALVKEYGEALEFWTWDRQPLDVFMKLASTSNADAAEMINTIRVLVLDEDGRQIIDKDNMLPTDVLVAVIGKIVATLGK